MALTLCRGCAKQVSVGTVSCPHCGAPDPWRATLTPQQRAQNKRMYRRFDFCFSGHARA